MIPTVFAGRRSTLSWAKSVRIKQGIGNRSLLLVCWFLFYCVSIFSATQTWCCSIQRKRDREKQKLNILVNTDTCSVKFCCVQKIGIFVVVVVVVVVFVLFLAFKPVGTKMDRFFYSFFLSHRKKKRKKRKKRRRRQNRKSRK